MSMEIKIKQLLNSKDPGDQLIAIELVKDNRDLKLEFIPVNNANSSKEYLENLSGITGFIQMKSYKLLIGCNTFRKVGMDFDLSIIGEYNELK